MPCRQGHWKDTLPPHTAAALANANSRMPSVTLPLTTELNRSNASLHARPARPCTTAAHAAARIPKRLPSNGRPHHKDITSRRPAATGPSRTVGDPIKIMRHSGTKDPAGHHGLFIISPPRRKRIRPSHRTRFGGPSTPISSIPLPLVNIYGRCQLSAIGTPNGAAFSSRFATCGGTLDTCRVAKFARTPPVWPPTRDGIRQDSARSSRLPTSGDFAHASIGLDYGTRRVSLRYQPGVVQRLTAWLGACILCAECGPLANFPNGASREWPARADRGL